MGKPSLRANSRIYLSDRCIFVAFLRPEGEIKMLIKRFRLSLVLIVLGLFTSIQVFAKEPPVAKIVQFQGQVEYTRNGVDWKPVRRTKYLFSGYQLRTGKDSKGMLVNQISGTSQLMGASTQVEFDSVQAKVIFGDLSAPEETDSSVMQSLTNKFATAQRYTTVRRSLGGNEDTCDSKVRTIRSVTVSPAYSDLVWRNACPEFSYKLIIDGGAPINVPAHSTSEMIRYSVVGSGVGEHTYRVEVLDKDGTVYIPRKDSNFQVMSAVEEQEVIASLAQAGDDIFMETNLLEERGLHVAAMDIYREYFSGNSDDNDMRPLLIQAYQKLKLSNLRESEARLYNAGLDEEF